MIDTAYTYGVDLAGQPIQFHHMDRGVIYWHTAQWRTVEYDGSTYWVHRYNLLASTWRGDAHDGIYYKVYEPTHGWAMHSTSTSIPDEWDMPIRLGDVTTRTLPAIIDAIPAGPDRSSAYGSWRKDLEKYATAIARSAFPEYTYLEHVTL